MPRYLRETSIQVCRKVGMTSGICYLFGGKRCRSLTQNNREFCDGKQIAAVAYPHPKPASLGTMMPCHVSPVPRIVSSDKQDDAPIVQIAMRRPHRHKTSRFVNLLVVREWRVMPCHLTGQRRRLQ